jgi:hypothetical protein
MMNEKLRAAAQAALDAMKLARGDHGTVMLAYPAIESWLYHRVDQRLDDAIKAVEDALAEPAIKESLTVAEPVAWMSDSDVGFYKEEFGNYPCVPLYAAPPRREWVGLTAEDMADAHNSTSGDVMMRLAGFARAIEAKLRNKNT